MNLSNQTQEEKLLAELRAIEHWDRDYYLRTDHLLL